MLEREFVGLYAEKGRTAKAIRLMVGLLLLKQIENLSDERAGFLRDELFSVEVPL